MNNLKFKPTFINKWYLLATETQKHPYHVVTQSPWPIFVSFLLFTLVKDIIWVFEDLKFYNFESEIFFFISYDNKINLLKHFLFFISILIMWFHDVKIESVTGHHTKRVAKCLRWGFFLMILSEIMFFFSFFWGLFHYSLCLEIWTGTTWPIVKGIPACWGPAWAGTAFLITSSWWISEAKVQFLWGQMKICMYCIFCTLWCGLMFLFIQQWEFLSISLTINNSCHGSIFFILTGFHCLHVIIGMFFILHLYIRIIKNKHIFVREKSVLFDTTIWYWHFVDYVWIFLFIILYGYLGI